jgi:K+-sensing histidine kinase KdpD
VDGRGRFAGGRLMAGAAQQLAAMGSGTAGLPTLEGDLAAGGEADGQVAVTRKTTKTLARIARTREVKTIVIDETPYTGWRRFVEGDVGTELAKRLRADGIEVIVIPYDPNDPKP